MVDPALAARLLAAVQAAAQDELRALGREAEASGAGMIELASAFCEAMAAAGGVTGPAPFLACLLEPYEAARGMQRASVGRLMNAQEEERRRLAAAIHDEPIQIMAAAYLRLQMLSRKLTSAAEREACEALEQTVKLAVQSLQRLILELKPTALDITGLADALEAYLGQLELHTGIAFRLVNGLSTQPCDQNRLILYRAAQEAVTGIIRHAPASTVTVALSEDDAGFTVRIDDGGGTGNGRATGPRSSLPFMRERAEAVGGSCLAETVAGATTVAVWVPRTDDAPAAGR